MLLTFPSGARQFLIAAICIETVSIITSDGRNIVVRKNMFSLPLPPSHNYFVSQGSLKGYDQTMNIILEQSHERIFSEDKGVVINTLGLYIIRGDNM